MYVYHGVTCLAGSIFSPQLRCGMVEQLDAASGRHLVHYQDGATNWVMLREVEHRIVDVLTPEGKAACMWLHPRLLEMSAERARQGEKPKQSWLNILAALAPQEKGRGGGQEKPLHPDHSATLGLGAEDLIGRTISVEWRNGKVSPEAAVIRARSPGCCQSLVHGK